MMQLLQVNSISTTGMSYYGIISGRSSSSATGIELW